MSVGTSLIGSVGVAVYGFLFDAFGSYDPSFVMGIATCVAGAVLAIVGVAAAKGLREPSRAS